MPASRCKAQKPLQSALTVLNGGMLIIRERELSDMRCGFVFASSRAPCVVALGT